MIQNAPNASHSPDPLGLSSFKTLIKELHRQTQHRHAADPAVRACADIAKQMDAHLQKLENRYNAWKDRYVLLKRANAVLVDEVSWLRDQLDDLFAETQDIDDVK
jgi:hypothetical protein